MNQKLVKPVGDCVDQVHGYDLYWFTVSNGDKGVYVYVSTEFPKIYTVSISVA